MDIYEIRLKFTGPKTDTEMGEKELAERSDEWLFDDLEYLTKVANRYKYVDYDIINTIVELKRRGLVAWIGKKKIAKLSTSLEIVS